MLEELELSTIIVVFYIFTQRVSLICSDVSETRAASNFKTTETTWRKNQTCQWKI